MHSTVFISLVNPNANYQRGESLFGTGPHSRVKPPFRITIFSYSPFFSTLAPPEFNEPAPRIELIIFILMTHPLIKGNTM